MLYIKSLKIDFMNLYFSYREGKITLDDYLKQIKYLDDEIDLHETQIFKCYQGDTPASEIIFS